MLSTLSSVMEAACDDMRRGLITVETFESIWARVYGDALLADARDRR